MAQAVIQTGGGVSGAARPLLRVEGVTMRFGGLTANQDVSFSVPAGEIVGLLGPNGAGKTTLFSCISGFYKPTAGRVSFAGQDITGEAPETICRRGITRTFQIVRTFPDMTVLQNVMVGAFLRTNRAGAARPRALELLELTGLASKQDVLGQSLTIADKKRLELTRALATEPKLLMLDEVMAGLNPQERRDAVDLVRRIAQQGVTILMVEHVMEVVMPLAHHVVVLNYGRKIAEGTPEQITQNEDVIAAYLGERFRRPG